MVEIRSVRQNVPAAKPSILGGAMQGFGNAVNSINKTNTQKEQRAYDEKQQQAKNTQNLLVALANQGYIQPGPKAPGGKGKGGLGDSLPAGFVVGQKSGGSEISAGQKRAYDMGLVDTPEGYKYAQAKEKVEKELANNSTYQNLMSKRTKEAAKEMAEMKEFAINAELGNFDAMKDAKPNWLMKTGGNILKGAGNAAKSVGKGVLETSNAMAMPGTTQVSQSANQGLVNHFKKKNKKLEKEPPMRYEDWKAQQNQQQAVKTMESFQRGESLKKPDFIKQEHWDAATPEQRLAKLNELGLN